MDILFHDDEWNIKFYKTDAWDETYKTPSDDELILDLWEDLRIIPESAIDIPPPEVKEQYTEVEGGMGSIDLTTFLTGYPLYKNRSGSFNLLVTSERANWEIGTNEAYESNNQHSSYGITYKINKLYRFLHGQRLIMKLGLDRNWGRYYVGRFKITDIKTEKTHRVVTVSYVLDPLSYYTTYSLSIKAGETRGAGFTNISDIITMASSPIYPTIPIIYSDATVNFSFINDELGISFTTTLQPGRANIGSRAVMSNFSATEYGENNHISFSLSGNTSGNLTVYYVLGGVL